MVDVREAETVVVGAGPGGVAAACTLAEEGREVLLVDESPRAGGQIWRHQSSDDLPVEARQWLGRLAESSVRQIGGASVVDVEPDGSLLAEGTEGPIRVRWQNLVLATGARELYLPFPGWTLPGVLGLGAVQALAKAGTDFSDARVVLAGSGPLLLPVAGLLVHQGANVKLIAEQATRAEVVRFAAGLWRYPSKIQEAIGYRLQTSRVPYRFGIWLKSAHGDSRVQGVELTNARRTWTESCDLVGCSYGLVPNTEMARLLGCEVEGGKVKVDGLQTTSLPNIRCVGEGTGVGGAEKSLVEGQIAALSLADREEEARALAGSLSRQRRFAEFLGRSFHPRKELSERLTDETIVCRCEDVKWKELQPGWSSRQAKLYTRVGMGPCQARVCGAALGHLCGWEPDSVRPPLKPSRVSTLIGQGSRT